MKSITILYAEDDKEDQLLVKDAFGEAKLGNRIDFVENGYEVMDYLHRKNGFENLKDEALPGLILLDLNMPKKDGREVLKEIKQHDELRHIPICILTTSKVEEDILQSYSLGVSSFIRKPVTFSSLVNIVRQLGSYWFNIVELPQ
jgi:CheY-like chemotaxis protein